MKIALVWNHRSRLLDCSFRFEQYVRGFRELGHEVVVVCDRASAQGFEGPLEVAPDCAVFEQADFWRSLAADVAVIVTWHRMAAVLQAMRAAGTEVISIADTDGRVGLKVHPWATLQRMIVYDDRWTDRARSLKYWLGRYLTDGFRGSPEDREFVASTHSSSSVVLGNAQARLNFGRYLARHGEERLGARLFVVPFTIGESFLVCPLAEEKDDRIVAIGRWSDPQKDSGLLAAALGKYLDERRRTEVVILGEGGERRFGPLAEKHRTVRCLGVTPQVEVARILSSSRAIVFSSRWEGSPHAATEALALGATLIGTPIPSLVSWSAGGRFGTVSRSRRPRALARAIAEEMDAWETGRRDPGEISRHWRSRLRPQEVCRCLLATVDQPRGDQPGAGAFFRNGR